MKAAERTWCIQFQLEGFPEEIELLTKGEAVQRSSRLVSLSPFLVDGLLCLDGMTKSGDVLQGTKQPVILDPKHPYTNWLVSHYHQQACIKDRR
jgi:hypothetical protein